MTYPQPPSQTVVRHYTTDAHYTADAHSMAAAGWRVIASQRMPDGSILATYAPPPGALPAHPTMQPPNQPPRLNWRDWRTRVIAGAVVLALILACVVGSSLVRAVEGGASASIVPTREPTLTHIYNPMTPLPTATPAAQPIAAARLGGPVSAFISAFGPEQGQDTWYTTLGGQSVMLIIQTSGITGGQITTPDGQDRVWTFSLSYLGPTPSAAQNAAICRQLFPLDAQHIADAANVAPTIEHIYRSRQLAASFDANAFQNNAGADVTPGTFSVVYGARTCDVVTGQD